MKKALIVFGGWSGHEPEKCNEILTKLLNSEGYEVRSENSTEAFAEDYVHEMDLIIPIVTMAFHHSPKGEIKKNEVNNLKFSSSEKYSIADTELLNSNFLSSLADLVIVSKMSKT